MKSNGYIMDAAQYIIEPKDLWTARVPSKHAASAPKVVALQDGGEAWSFQDGTWVVPLGLESAAGYSPAEFKEQGCYYDSARPGMYSPTERLTDMNVDEIDAAVIFPTFGLQVRNIRDPELQVASVQGYNDGLWEWAQGGDPSRLIPQAIMPTTGLDTSIAELKRIINIGYKGIVFSGWPSGSAEPRDIDDPFWGCCEEAGIVIHLLRGGPSATDHTAAIQERTPGGQGAPTQISSAMRWAQIAASHNLNMSYLIMSGILDRHPGLKVTLIDAGAGWLPVCGELLDWNYRNARFTPNAFGKFKHQPSDYIRRHVKVTLKDEHTSIESRHDIGINSLMWSSNYPNSTSTWPNSHLTIERLFRDVPKHERARILGTNCAELYEA